MADNKLLLRRDSDEDFLAEDDPLAALARIAGVEPVAEIRPRSFTQRREPEFDLEDELLREFEQYEAPEPVAARAPAVESAPVMDADPAFEAEELYAGDQYLADDDRFLADVEAEIAPEPAPFVLQEVEKPAENAAEQAFARPASHPVFDLEDEILREFAAFDARHVPDADAVATPVTAEIVRQEPVFENEAETSFEQEAEPAEFYEVPELAQHAAVSQPVDIKDDIEVQPAEAAVSETDLTHDFAARQAVETETAFAPHSSEPDVDDAFAALPELSEPEADFSEEDARYWAELEQETSARRDAFATAVADEDEAAFEAPAFTPEAEHFAAAHPAIAAEAEEAVPAPLVGGYDDYAPAQSFQPAAEEPAPAPVQAIPADHPVFASRPTLTTDYGLDELLAEVEKYPVGDNSGRWGVQAQAASPDDLIPPPVAAVESFAVADPVEEKPVDDEPIFDVVEQAPLAYAPPSHAVAEEAADDDIPFDENSFELDFGDIELDLSELHEDVTASPEALAEVADADLGRAQAYAARASEPVLQEDYSSLPFDPSQIVAEDEPVEALAEMDVPEVPVVHEEVRPAAQPEYDLDVDAEMASLFAGAVAQRPAHADAAHITAPARGGQEFGASGQSNRPSELELDEFERALEEDFRRSFAENRNVGNPDRVALAPAYRGPAGTARSRRTWALLAGSAVAIVLFGGAGVWAFMSGDTKMLASSEPKIILADTDPVKIVPDDKGGRQVPNQNKAVYDRVSGETTEVAKQESLLSSTEEPVDVVQRTLMPESLPMEQDAMAAATPTEDTIDPRLLPEEEQDRVTTTSRVVSGVSPRKVKTMVVKSDGSLIAREETAEDVQQQAANDAELMKIARKAAEDAAKPVDTAGDDIAKAIESVPERLTPDDQNAATADVPVKPVDTLKVDHVNQEEAAKSVTPPVEAENEVVKVDPIDAARVEETPAEQKPVEEIKPVETAVKPIEEAKPAEEVKAEVPVERSIPTTDTQAVDQSAVEAAANAEVEDAPVRKVKTSKILPVPENRPVDQPVTVVGTVTDQGQVQETEAKQQEVASVDPAEKPAETAAVPTGGYVIQIASLPSEAEAQSSYSKLSTKFASVIGGRGVDIKRAEVKNKGTYYRVRIPAGNKQEAQALCSQYKKAGGSCLVSK